MAFDTVKKDGTNKNAPWRKLYCKHLALTGNIAGAAKKSGVSRQAVYFHMNADPEFSAECDEAVALFCASIEGEIKRRAFAGSDLLLMAMANRHMPAEYRQRQEIQQTITHDYVVEIGTARVPAITEHTTDTIQDVTPFRMYETTRDILE
jgi:hypothetical protein